MLRKMKLKGAELKIHKYVVKICKREKREGDTKPYVYTKYFYCKSMKEVKEMAKTSKKGSWILVYKADHNFIQGYAHE